MKRPLLHSRQLLLRALQGRFLVRTLIAIACNPETAQPLNHGVITAYPTGLTDERGANYYYRRTNLLRNSPMAATFCFELIDMTLV